MAKTYKIFAVCLMVFVLVYIGLIQLIPIEKAANLSYGGGARLFPWLLGIALLALIGYDFILTTIPEKRNRTAKELSGQRNSAEEETIEEESIKSSSKGLLVLLIAALIFVYQILIGFIGFIPSTIPFLFSLFRLFKVKSWPATILMSLVLPLIFYFIFEELFGVRLDFMRVKL